MKRVILCGQYLATMLVLLALFGVSARAAFAESPVKLKGEGAISLATQGPSPFFLSGTASHLGDYKCRGEMQLLTDKETGSQEGAGIAVFEAANGDRLVGVVTLQTDANGDGEIAFSWRDSVQFSDGTIVSSSGRFANSRPPGADSKVKTKKQPIIVIIAILIG